MGRFEDDDDEESEDESEDDDWSEDDSEDWSDDNEEGEGGEEEEEARHRKGAAGFDKAGESGRKPARGRRASGMAMRKVWWRVGGTAAAVVGLLRRALGGDRGRLCCSAPACKVAASFIVCVALCQWVLMGGG